jgi:tetratricopeptide (TPR) repeat protein
MLCVPKTLFNAQSGAKWSTVAHSCLRGVDERAEWRDGGCNDPMADDSHPITRLRPQRAPGVPLDSWKQIAGYLKRHVTTVRRWEKHEGLPVHRHFHSKLGSIYANSSELDAWLNTRRSNQSSVTSRKPLFERAGEVVPFERPSPPAVLPSWPGSFIARDAELATLSRAWEAVRSGRGQLVLIAGEPGIGKTRLATEFARSIGDHATVLTGRCELEAIVPFAPFIEVLRRLVRNTPPPAIRQLLKSIDGSVELVQLLPELATHVRSPRTPVVATPEGRRYRMFDAFAEYLAATSLRKPLLVLLEDMHWADHGAILLLRHVVRSTHASAILFIVTCREAAMDATASAGEILSELRRDPSTTRMALRGLADDHVRDLVAATTGPETPRWVTSAIAAKAGGNPLFVIEMAKHLVETNVQSDAVDLELPDTIRDLLERRLLRLSEATRTLLALASVVGREFDMSVLDKLDRVSEVSALDALDEAVAAKVIVEDSRLPGRFSFAHALIRDVLYRSMTGARRVRLHHQIAQVIERQSGGDLPLGDLAYHFGQAASFCDAEKATDYASRAGDEALEAFALEDAARYYEMALRSLDRAISGQELQDRQAELQDKRGRSYFQAGRWASAKVAFEAALALLPSGDHTKRGEVLVRLAETSFWLMNVSDVQRFAADAYAVAERIGCDDLAADALAWMASAKVSDGDVAGGIEIDRQALARAGGVRSFGLARAPLTLYWAGRTSEAVDRAAQGVEHAHAANDPAFLLYALQHWGLSLCSVGRYDESLQAFEEARAVGRRSGALPLLARAISMSVAPWLSLGDLDSAGARAQEARELARRVAFEPPMVSAGIDLLVIFARKRDPGSADALLDEVDRAVRVARGWHAWKWKLRLSHARSELAMARGQWADAIQEADQVVEQSRARTRLKYEALGLATRAAAERQLRRKAATADAQAAIEVARRLDDPAVLLHCLTVRLEIDGSKDVLAEAQRTVQRMLTAVSDERLRRTFLDSVICRAATL